MVDSDDSYHPNEDEKSSSAGKTSSLFAENSSNMSSSSEIDKLRTKALENVEDINLTLGGILSSQERIRNECLKLKNEHERLVDMYEGKLLKIDENLRVHRRQKEKWRNEKAELEMNLSALKNKLILKDKKMQTNDAREQKELRKELIELFKVSTSDQEEIGLKQMGELDCAAFKEAVKRNLGENGTEDKVSKLCKTWQILLMNPQWLPIKTAPMEGSEDQHKRVVDTEDKKLTMLKTAVGDEAYEVVVAALEEMCEYNPRGRCLAPEVWNFKENRKATLREGLSYLNGNGRGLKRGRNCSSCSL